MKAPSYLQLLSFPFEASTSFQKGTRFAPKAVMDKLSLSRHEDVEFSKVCSSEETDPRHVVRLGFEAVLKTLKSGGFPLSIGGEHTVSVGPIRAAASSKKIGIVQLDAHADLRDTFGGSKWSHAAAMRRAVEGGIPLLGIGIRAISKQEADYVKSRDDIKLVEGREGAFSSDWYHLLESLPDNIYLTVDMDCFDPVEVPAVGTPEPGGMGFDAVVRFLTHLFENKNVVAADVVELCPMPGDESSISLTVKLIERILMLRFGRGF